MPPVTIARSVSCRVLACRVSVASPRPAYGARWTGKQDTRGESRPNGAESRPKRQPHGNPRLTARVPALLRTTTLALSHSIRSPHHTHTQHVVSTLLRSRITLAVHAAATFPFPPRVRAEKGRPESGAPTAWHVAARNLQTSQRRACRPAPPPRARSRRTALPKSRATVACRARAPRGWRSRCASGRRQRPPRTCAGRCSRCLCRR
jgi:hypothetical protein